MTPFLKSPSTRVLYQPNSLIRLLFYSSSFQPSMKDFSIDYRSFFNACSASFTSSISCFVLLGLIPGFNFLKLVPCSSMFRLDYKVCYMKNMYYCEVLQQSHLLSRRWICLFVASFQFFIVQLFLLERSLRSHVKYIKYHRSIVCHI